MHIEFVRTGGFAGLRLITTVDTQVLPQEQASIVEAMIRDSGFFELPEKLLPPSPSPDRFEYRVTVSTDKESHSIVGQGSVPWRSVLETLHEIRYNGLLIDEHRTIEGQKLGKEYLQPIIQSCY